MIIKKVLPISLFSRHSLNVVNAVNTLNVRIASSVSFDQGSIVLCHNRQTVQGVLVKGDGYIQDYHANLVTGMNCFEIYCSGAKRGQEDIAFFVTRNF